MTGTLAIWRIGRRGSWRATALVVIVGGLLGAVTLASLAGARRTDSAYQRYLHAIAASDVFVNVPTPDLNLVREIGAGTTSESASAYLGMGADPVIRGHIVNGFQTNNLEGSLDGEYFEQDRMTLVDGRLPRLAATNEIALTPAMARFFGVGVGDTVRWAFFTTRDPKLPPAFADFTVTGIVDVPPALTDQFDQFDTAVIPPAATQVHLASMDYGWVGLRLHNGSAGLPRLRSELSAISAENHNLPLALRQLDTVHAEVQQSIRPQATALAIFSVVVALALTVLMGLALSNLVVRTSRHHLALAAIGASRRQQAACASLQAIVAIGVGLVIAVGLAIAVSPFAPVGAVRQVDPTRGVHVDLASLGFGLLALGVVMCVEVLWIAWRSTNHQNPGGTRRRSRIVDGLTRTQAPLAALIGARHALQSEGTPTASPFVGSTLAVAAVVATVVFGTNLTGLVDHPVRYGWNWNLLLQTEGGYGHWRPATIENAVNANHGILGWSTFGFSQVAIDGITVPTLGITEIRGDVAPPTTSGHGLEGPDEIELGDRTLDALHKHVGDVVTVGSGPAAQQLRVVGTVTLPSVGLVYADHVSLGRGAMLSEATMLSVLGNPSDNCTEGCPSAVAIDLSRSSNAAAVATAISATKPDGIPGGTYRVDRPLGAEIVNAKAMGSEPRTLALSLALAAVIALAMAVLASVRRRRVELGVLKALGLRRRDVGAIAIWHTTITLSFALVIGLVSGVAGGRVAWRAFASSLGAVPTTSVPIEELALGAVGLLVLGVVLSALPARTAARTDITSTLRAE